MNKYLIIGLGVSVGLLGGFAYWHFVGCASGTCPITSKPLNSTLYGGLLGYLFVNAFLSFKEK